MTNMFKPLRCFLVSLFLTLGFASMSSAQEYTLKLAHVLSTDTPAHKAAEMMSAQIFEKSNGRVKIDIFPAGQVGNDTEIVEQIQIGAVHMGMPPTAKLGQFEPRMQLFDLPYIFPTREAAYAVLDGAIGEQLLKTLDKQGLYGAAYWESGFKQITTNSKSISLPSDLAGIKMRTMSSPIIIEQYKTWGANPIPIAFAEVYNALQQGVADAQENSFVTIDKMKFWEVQKFLTVSNHAYLGYAFIVNKAIWEKMPSDLQAVVQKGIEAGRDHQRKLNAGLDDTLKQLMIDRGLTVNELDSDGIAAFVEASKPVHEGYKSVIGKDLLESTYKLTSTFINN